MSNDPDRVCFTWDLDESVLEEDNVEIPTDDFLYFYIKILFRFKCRYGDLVNRWEEQHTILIPREQLLSDDETVVQEAISYMIRAMGAVPQPSDSIVNPIIEMARSKATTSGHMKVIPFSVQINVDDFLDPVPDFESEWSELSDEEWFELEEEWFGLSDEEWFEPSEEDQEEEKEEEEELSESTKVETCSICLDNVALDGRRGTQKMQCCKQVFHDKCIKRWLTVKNLCPLCRHEIPNS